MNKDEKKAIRFALYKEDPLLTSRLDVEIDETRFFERYGVICFQSEDPKMRHLPYESLTGLPILAVAGIGDRFLPDVTRFSIRFFLLVEREDMAKVCDFLRGKPVKGIVLDRMIPWNEKQKKRVIASLAVNSLGRILKSASRKMYNTGALLLFDDRNFGFDRETDGIVGLKIEVSPYLILTAETATFSHPYSVEQLEKYTGDVFHLSSRIEGDLWIGDTLKPISIEQGKESAIPLEELYIRKGNYGSHNIVEHWPFDRENYTRGKLFAMWEMVREVNQRYKGMVRLSFNQVTSYEYDEYESSKEMMASLYHYMRGREISIIDPFQGERSRQAIENLKVKWHHPDLMGEDIRFTENDLSCPMLIYLTDEKPSQNELEKAKRVLKGEKKKEDEKDSKWTPEYAKTLLSDEAYHRLDDLSGLGGHAVQHVIVPYLHAPVKDKKKKDKEKEDSTALAEPLSPPLNEDFADIVLDEEEMTDTVPKDEQKKTTPKKKGLAKARRILMELMAKECVLLRKIPSEMVSVAPGWRFWEYKIIDGVITGSWLEILPDGRMEIGPFHNTVSKTPYFYELFVEDVLRYPGNPRVFQGAQDYRVFSKEGNVYMIINTDEIPMLDGEVIDAEYERIETEKDKLSAFKRVDDVHRNFRAYIGFHMWETETFDKVPRAYAYTNGVYRTELNISEKGGIMRMPRIKLLYVLSAERPELIDNQLSEIVQLLKHGMGRWREMMTYPLPYKFLGEYLDREAECVYGFHWYEVNQKRVRAFEKELADQNG